MSRIAVIGNGYVGQAMVRLFGGADIYDPALGYKDRSVMAEADLIFVCVPTPQSWPDGECDSRAVEETVIWLTQEIKLRSSLEGKTIVLKSTVTPGTTRLLCEEHGLERVLFFSPEFIGESKYYTPDRYPDPEDQRRHGFVVIGSHPGARDSDRARALEPFKAILGPCCRYVLTDATLAEAMKYMSNTWAATKVGFANEWFDLCEEIGISYDELRELWLLDRRTEPMHTAVFREARGFSGKCLPKDLHAIVSFARSHGLPVPIMTGALQYAK
jgi:UDPglucose 6-dehydrogenase